MTSSSASVQLSHCLVPSITLLGVGNDRPWRGDLDVTEWQANRLITCVLLYREEFRARSQPFC